MKIQIDPDAETLELLRLNFLSGELRITSIELDDHDCNRLSILLGRQIEFGGVAEFESRLFNVPVTWAVSADPSCT